MKILFIGPVGDYLVKDGGYGNAGSGMSFVLEEMLKGKTIGELKVLDTSKNLALQEIDYEKKYDVGILIVNPAVLRNRNDQIFLYNLMSKCSKKYLNILWETIPLPRVWNFLWEEDTFFDGFLASSYFIGAQLLKLTKKKVYYCPLYVSPQDYSPINLEEKEKENFFTVLFMGQNTRRKGIEDAIIAFSRAFDSVNDVQMIVKSHILSQTEIPLEELIHRTASSNMTCKDSPIYLLTDKFSKKEMNRLYNSASVLLFPSRGEGFGLPICESMLCGLPVIYTDWSSSYEVGFSPVNLPASYILDEAYNMFQYGYEIDSYYAIPNIRDLIKKLIFLYNFWKGDKKAYYTLYKQNRDVILGRYSKEILMSCFDHVFNSRDNFCPEAIYIPNLMKRWSNEWDTLIGKGNALTNK